MVWGKKANECEAKTGEIISEQSRNNMFLNKIVATHMRQHLMLNQQRLATADAIANEIEVTFPASDPLFILHCVNFRASCGGRLLLTSNLLHSSCFFYLISLF